MTKIAIKMLDKGLPVPRRAYLGDAGMDLYAVEDACLEPGDRVLMGTGVALAIPPDLVGLVMPRSGLAHRHGVTVLNAPGVVDSGFRGEIHVNLICLDSGFGWTVRRGMRIAQIVFQEVRHPDLIEVDELDDTGRGEKGYGSSGVGIPASLQGVVGPTVVVCTCPRRDDHAPGDARCWGTST